ncbi:Ff.00g035640.m01.CDS01 [Fusarium sp. VM40]|nr:Ff.00g035640.m01.CDS01 [Fusarium sp. VM40]
MATNVTPHPKIPVLYWDANNVYVECPYCEEKHRHGFSLSGKRMSHCYPGGGYEFVYPVDLEQELVGYEIDKTRAYFVNVGLTSDRTGHRLDPLNETDDELADVFGSTLNLTPTNAEPESSLEEESSEMTVIDLLNGDKFELKVITLAISECLFGNTTFIKQYINMSIEAQLFLHGRDKCGNTTLIMAAVEESYEMVSLLLENGANVNAINHCGRNALMEAALWGRIETVKILLNFDANKSLRDHHGRCAKDFAEPCRENEEERNTRSPRAAEKQVYERNGDRRHIAILLRDPNADNQNVYTKPLSNSQLNNYSFKKSPAGMTITFSGPIQEYSVPQITKTAAILDRGVQFARVSATSGWGRDALPVNRAMERTWVEQVDYIARIVGYTFQAAPSPKFDQGTPGQYYASHAEKKLIAYFLDKHVFLPEDRSPHQVLGESIDALDDSVCEARELFATCAKVSDLESQKQKLERDLFGADDYLLGEEYDQEEVQDLKQKISEISKELSNLESDRDVTAIREKEKERMRMMARYRQHERLEELSRPTSQPPLSLRHAVILSSNDNCLDCKSFKERVNKYFGLDITYAVV